MEIGDLVKISDDWSEIDIEGIGVVANIYQDPEGEFGSLLVSVLWGTGRTTNEYFVSLEVVPCK